MSAVPVGRLSVSHAVFAALFAAVETAEGEFNEARWEDLIAVLDATGRLVFGWPRLESSESDIFGALDDIADQLEGTKNAITMIATEARIVLGQLHEALDPLLPMDDESAAGPSPVVEVPPPDQREPIEPIAEPPPHRSLSPEVIARRGPRGSYQKNPTPQEVAAFYETHGRDETAAHFGIGTATVMRRVGEWERATSESRRGGAAPYTPLQVVHPATKEESGDERRKRLASETVERTWKERHPDETRA